MALDIPKWVGPAVTPVVLILLIMVLCFYYCYWKPKKERKMKGNASDVEKNTKKTNVQSLYPKQKSPYPIEDVCYYDSVIPIVSYGPYCPDICPLPTANRLNYCRPHDFVPQKMFYYPPNPKGNLCRTVCKKQCQGFEKIKGKVKCPKGECMKCPKLSIIMEGDSVVEEEEDQDSKLLESEKTECSCNEKCLENKEEVGNGEDNISQTSNDSGVSNTCHDSGYEDNSN